MSSILPQDSEFSRLRNLVVSASAGSGKTTALTHRLVQLLLSDRIPHNDLRNILAVTFTNNAALDMKRRALELLRKAARGDKETTATLGSLLSMDESQLRIKAEFMVEEILDNYSDFQVQTIDSFLVRVFKASALEFGFPPDFEIVIGGGRLLDDAFDLFARDVWDGSERAQLILELVERLVNVRGEGKRYMWSPYNALAREVKRLYGSILNTSRPLITDDESNLDEIAEKVLTSMKKLDRAIADAGVERSASFQNYMTEVSQHKINHLLSLPAKIYNKGGLKKDAFDRIKENLDPLVEEVKSLQGELALQRARLYFQPYLRAHKLLGETLDLIKRRQGELDLADATYKLAQEINLEIVPEIYFNLGETIHHYLIDEFQDTGPVQWSNLHPLIDNALSGGGSLFVVGDTKQSIYGFRGGDWRIMKELMEQDVFPSAPRDKKDLPFNWRSGERIVEFTKTVFHDVVPKRITNGAEEVSGLGTFKQESVERLKGKGYVERTFIEGDTEERPERDRIIKTIQDCLTRGYSKRDIAILTPENEDVVQVSGWLNEEGIDFIPFSTLDIRTRKVIGELLAFLRFLDSPIDDLAFATFLLGNTFNKLLKEDDRALSTDDLRQLLFEHARSGIRRPFYTQLRERHPTVWETYFDELFGLAGYLPLYDLASHMLKHLRLFTVAAEEEAALVKLLEVVKNFEERGENSLREFVNYVSGPEEDADWNMAVPPTVDAIPIMTVHKAKGLGFPVVLVLLYDVNLQYGQFFLDESEEGVRLMRIVKSEAKDLEILAPFWKQKELNARVDQLNKLYVALTRAEDEMYVLSVKYDRKSEPSAFLPQEGFDSAQKPKCESKKRRDEERVPLYHHHETWRQNVQAPWGIRWKETQRGDLVHRILARIKFLGDDVVSAVRRAVDAEVSQGGDEFDRNEVENVLTPFFQETNIGEHFAENDGRIVMNEQEFSHRSGKLLRMDRVVIDADKATVIDYKTGGEQTEHIEQVKEYMDVLREIYSLPVKGLLAYVDLKLIRSVE
jgi:ATP-dependent helicase/nuclease subunit A